MASTGPSRHSNRFALLWFGLPVAAAIILLLFVVRESPIFPGKDNGDSFGPAISADGRYIAFTSYDSGLLEDEQTDCAHDDLCWNVYVRNRETGEVVMASTNSQGEPALFSRNQAFGPGSVGVDAGGAPYNAATISPFGDGPTSVSISDDGRYVVFASAAVNLGDGAAVAGLFRKDMQSGELEPVVQPQPQLGAQGWAYFFMPAMSGDGRFVAFWSYSPPRGMGGEDGAALYVCDMATAEPQPVSINSMPGGGRVMPSQAPNPIAISADGRFIVFVASPMSPIATDFQSQVFVKDRQTDELRAISTSTSGDAGDGPSRVVSISADGRLAAFESAAANLVPQETCKRNSVSCSNVYLKDLQSGETRLLSKTESGAAMNNAGSSVISQDGGSVAFVTLNVGPPSEQKESFMAPGLTETIYLSDLKSGRMLPVTPETVDDGDSKIDAGTAPVYGPYGDMLPVAAGLAGGQGIDISADGRYIAFPGFDRWLELEERMCETRFPGGEGLFGIAAPPSSMPCTEIFLKDMLTGELSRVSAPA